jgi:hypothetical protein
MTLMVTMADCRAAKLCARGVREFMHRHDLDYREFMEHGLSAEVISATGEYFATVAVEQAQKRATDAG